jgi:hypothetical protein
MPIAFVCPFCGRRLRCADEMVGKSVKCVTCGDPVTVPTPRVGPPGHSSP